MEIEDIIKEKTVCFSGHREVNENDMETFKKFLSIIVEMLYKKGYRYFIVGMAMGFDLMAANCIFEFRLKHRDVNLIAAIPFEGHQDRYTDEWKELHYKIVLAADLVVEVQDHYSKGVYLRRNDWMIDKSSMLIAYCDKNKKQGGTVYTINKARRKGLKVSNIHS